MTIFIRAKREKLIDKWEIEMTNKRYDKEYKVQAVKLIKEIGMTKASKELGVSSSTMRGVGSSSQTRAVRFRRRRIYATRSYVVS